MRDKMSLTIPSCPSGTGAEVTWRHMTSEQRSAGLSTDAVGSIRDPFDPPLLGRGPVHRKGLRAGPNDHSDKLMGLACGEASRVVNHLNVAVFIDSPQHHDMYATGCGNDTAARHPHARGRCSVRLGRWRRAAARA